jgi:hypothetical protein
MHSAWKHAVRPTASTGFHARSYKRGARPREMLALRNKAPAWNEHLGAYCLSFGGRVTAASVKNFQLVEPRNEDSVLLQFGKVSGPRHLLSIFNTVMITFAGSPAAEEFHSAQNESEQIGQIARGQHLLTYSHCSCDGATMVSDSVLIGPR